MKREDISKICTIAASIRKGNSVEEISQKEAMTKAWVVFKSND